MIVAATSADRVTEQARVYPVAGIPTTEAAIDLGVTRDLYLVIGDQQEAGGWAVRTYIKPFANWIWLGAIIMGEVLAETDLPAGAFSILTLDGKHAAPLVEDESRDRKSVV